MYFKQLEMIGFKSFADGTVLKFEPGVTAIVGPNGCGKSNISDSIKWVLGEQSAKELRGGKMEDIIFNGTDTKEPLGMAEVSLTLNNENRALLIDYEEVTITRRLFRSGESEYLLNKTPVRLKDISELLMGTGIGTDSYSIIGQGKIDLILSSQPEDRRYIFEEASGITRYKSKKKEAMRKLEQTESNLLRLSDIITEVQRQLNSIERQARKAERYKEEFEKLKALDSKASYCEFKKLNSELSTLCAEKYQLGSTEGALASEIDNFSKGLNQTKELLTNSDHEFQDAQNKKLELELRLNKNQTKVTFNAERVNELRKRREDLFREIDEQKNRLAELQNTTNAVSAQLNSVSESRSGKENSLIQKQGQTLALESVIRGCEETIKKCKLSIIDMLSQQTKLRNSITKLASDIQNKSMRARRLNVENDKVGEELKGLCEQASAISKLVEETDIKINEARNNISLSQKDLAALKAEREGITKDINGLQSQKIILNSKLEFLIDLTRRHEGFSTSVKALLDDIESGGLSTSGVHGAIAGLIEPKKGFEAAIEAALGDMVQAIVVENASAGKNMIEHLKNRNLGRATFIIKDSFASVRADADHTREGLKNKILDNMQIKEGFDCILRELLKDTYLVDNIDEGLDVCSKLNDPRINLVTANGEVIRNGVIISSGVFQGEVNLLVGRESKIRELKETIVQIEQKIGLSETQKLAKDKAVNGLKARLDTGENALRSLELEMAERMSNKSNIEEQKKRLEDETSLVKLEMDEITGELDSMAKSKAALEAELNNLDERHAQTQNMVSSSEGTIESSKSQREALVVAIAELKTELSLVDKEQTNLSSTIDAYTVSMKDAQASLKAKSDEIAGSESKTRELEEETAHLSGENEEVLKNKEALGRELDSIKTQRSQLVGQLASFENELAARKTNLDGLKERAHAIELTQKDINFKAHNLKEKAVQFYKIDLDNFSVEIDEGADWNAVYSEITALKEKLERMGEVNLVAIEEHKELQDRLEFLTHQKEDLVSAKESLQEAIKKINKTTKELFMETFTSIQGEFKNFFRLLFGGGQAELILLDQQDVLESGIEIIVRPPGKKLQSITLLSGGEKALTAIALLFAVFKVKPSPFCILDEIDAPLDESNIDRFSNVLKDFLTTSQFIIITHNKKTLLLADVMYGITMQEKGVSKIVSVKFSDKDTEDIKEEAVVV